MSIPIGQSTTIEAPEFNRRLHLTYIYGFIPRSPESQVPNPPSGSPGGYKVRFVLCTPGQEEFFSTIDVVKIPDLGKSPLKAAVPPDGGMRVDLCLDPRSSTRAASILFGTNDANEISHADMTVQAANFQEAYRTAYNLVLPQLSWWSYSQDVGIGVMACHITEERTKSIRLIVGCLGKPKVIEIGITKLWPLTPIWRQIFSSYREALSSNNIFFQFLCFYKVVEAVGKIRAVRCRREKAAGRLPHTPPERIPHTYTGYSLDEEAFAPYLGKKFTDVCDGFRETARNAIAHIDPFQTEPSLIADQCADVEKCEAAIPVIKYIAREMVKNEIAADPQMNALPAPSPCFPA